MVLFAETNISIPSPDTASTMLTGFICNVLVILAEITIVTIRTGTISIETMVMVVTVIAIPSETILGRTQTIGAVAAGTIVVVAALFPMGKFVVGWTDTHAQNPNIWCVGIAEIRWTIIWVLSSTVPVC